MWRFSDAYLWLDLIDPSMFVHSGPDAMSEFFPRALVARGSLCSSRVLELCVMDDGVVVSFSVSWFRALRSIYFWACNVDLMLLGQ